MSINYQAVGWNRQKKIYDILLLGSVFLYLALFIVFNSLTDPNATVETMLLRSFGTAAIILLHIILCIGPLCRLDNRFLPLLYNRRHMGVTMFVLGLVHAFLAIMQFHLFSDVNPIISIFTTNPYYTDPGYFPFQALGFIALIILFLMAATSHDFWLANLSAPVWKTLHMGVYLAWFLLIAHVLFGVIQAETDPRYIYILAFGVILVLGLHLIAALREQASDRSLSGDGFIEVCHVDDIPENRARIVTLSEERVAVFKYDGKVNAVSNVCQHQNGPLGEGKIIDGCITCPWHGYQYNPEDGSSPPPFTEKIPTFNVKVQDGKVFVHPKPNPPGSRVEPASIQV